VHGVLAVIAVVAALVHVLLVNYYVDTLWKQALWSLMAAAFIWLLLWVRLLRPLKMRRRPWTVERVRPERDRTTVLTLRPDGHDGLRFEPGHFAWITVDRSRCSRSRHTRSRCARAPRRAVASKSPSRPPETSVRASQPSNSGTRVYLDGPHGVFSIDQYEGAASA